MNAEQQHLFDDLMEYCSEDEGISYSTLVEMLVKYAEKEARVLLKQWRNLHTGKGGLT